MFKCMKYVKVSPDVQVAYKTSYMPLADVLIMFVCVDILRPSQPNGVMSSAVSLPNHTFTGQA